MKLINFILYPVYEIPNQIRRRIGFNAGTDDLAQLSQSVSDLGIDSKKDATYQQALSNIVGFDSSQNGFDIPTINISDDPNVLVPLKFEQIPNMYNFIGIFTAQPINRTRTYEIRYVVSGYTSQAEPTLTGLLPDNMIFYINDIYGIRVNYTTNSMGQLVQLPGSIVVESGVLAETLYDKNTNLVEFAVDPIEITKSADLCVNLNLKKGEKISPDTYFAHTLKSDSRMLTSHLVKPELFVESLSSSFLNHKVNSTVLDPYNQDEFFNSTTDSVETELRAKNIISLYSTTPFCTALKNALVQNTSLNNALIATDKANFTLNDLKCALDNKHTLIEQIANSLTNNRRNSVNMIVQTDDWVRGNGISTQGSIVAYDIGMRIGHILSRNHIGAISLVYDNRNATFDVEPTLTPIPHSIESITTSTDIPKELFGRFLRDINSLMISVSKHNKIRFSCIIHARLGTVTRIEITMDGDLMTEYYTMASFMISRLHIGITNSADYANNVAVDVSTLFKAIDAGFDSYTRKSSTDNLLNTIPTGDINFSGLGGMPNANLSADTSDFKVDLGSSDNTNNTDFKLKW